MHGLLGKSTVILVLGLILVGGVAFLTPPTLATAGTSGPENPPMEMTLAEAVHLALRTNRNVTSSFMDRVVQKFDLEVARDKFSPDVAFSSSASVSKSLTRTRDEDDSRSTDWGVSSSVMATKRIVTGGKFSFSWTRSDDWSHSNDFGEDRAGSNTWALEFVQPLLKGAGTDLNTASIRKAEMDEQSNLLNHRDTIISAVNDTISTFRTYAMVARRLQITEASLKRSKTNLELNRLMVEMRRMPANEIIQSESDVADQEFAYETALNDLDNVRLNLLKVLDLDRRTRIIPQEEGDPGPVHPDPAVCLETAFENRSDYIEAKMNIERARIFLLEAKDSMKWDLDLSSEASVSDIDERDAPTTNTYAIEGGLTLTIPVYGDLTRKQTLLRAETDLKQAELNLEEVRQNITLEVQDAVREVAARLKQVGLAERSRQLSEKKLAVEKEKLSAGRSTVFQVVSFQNDLVDSMNAELDAKVNYLNALTDLDTTLGSTLLTWKIDYNMQYDKWPVSPPK